MKVYEITKLITELKSDNVQYRNKIIYITVVALFWCHQLIATGTSAVTPYIDLLSVGRQVYPRHERKYAKSKSFEITPIIRVCVTSYY